MNNVTAGRFLQSMVLCAGVCCLALTGCRSPEKVSYKSDTWSPKTVTLLDTRTGESVVTIDVPVGKQLNMWFDKPVNTAENEGADTLRYSIRPWGDAGTIPGTTLTVPPPSARRLDVTLRKSPEQPSGT